MIGQIAMRSLVSTYYALETCLTSTSNIWFQAPLAARPSSEFSQRCRGGKLRHIGKPRTTMPLARPRLRPARSSGYQGHVGAASLGCKRPRLCRDRNLLRVKVRAIPRVKWGSAWILDLCVHLQLVWESSNFTRSSVPLIESLKSNAHFIIDARTGKNLTHSQSILLSRILAILILLIIYQSCPLCLDSHTLIGGVRLVIGTHSPQNCKNVNPPLKNTA